MKSASK
jgi:hypothetical protein